MATIVQQDRGCPAAARAVEGPAVEGAARRAYVVCSGPRTGSSLLCEALRGTGRTGRPAEYFDVHERNVAQWVRALKIERPEDYLDKVYAAGATDNGVFGLKLHWHQTPALLKAAGESAGGRNVDQILADRFPQRTYLWLRRRNKVAQGISYLRAIQSDVWRLERGRKAAAPAEPPRFDAAAIEHHVGLVTRFDTQWEAWFRSLRVPALVLIYEDFCRSYEETVRAVCRHLDVADRDLRIVPPRYEKQADAVSLEWEAEYRALKGLPAASEAPPLARSSGLALVKGPAPARPEPASAPAAPPQAEADPTQLIAYDLGGGRHLRLAAAPGRRSWMDATPRRFAYRCLPMVIANQHGWLLLAPYRIEAVWNGGEGVDAVTVSPPPEGMPGVAASHFGSGILTFSAHYLFRTPPGINLHVRGPANLPKDAISALEGIVETDWADATFTMNWKFTRAHQPVVFERNEPFAMLSPVRRGDIEAYRPIIVPIGSEPQLEADYRAWADSRAQFNADLNVRESDATKAGWQRHYTRGQTVTETSAGSHQTKIFVQEFDDRRPGGRTGSS